MFVIAVRPLITTPALPVSGSSLVRKCIPKSLAVFGGCDLRALLSRDLAASCTGTLRYPWAREFAGHVFRPIVSLSDSTYSEKFDILCFPK